MSWLTNLVGGGAKGLIDGIAGAADRFITTGDEKNAFKLEMQKLVTARMSEIEETARSELQARENIMVSEMKQGDNYTKRARPTIVYTGLGAIVFNYCVVPLLQTVMGKTIDPFSLPTEFWMAWGGVVGIYAIGRSAEKRGSQNPVVQAITGSGAGLMNLVPGGAAPARPTSKLVDGDAMLPTTTGAVADLSQIRDQDSAPMPSLSSPSNKPAFM